MSALTKLWLYKQWGGIRNVFRKPGSAIFTIFMVLFYGGLLISFFNMKLEITTFSLVSLHQCVLVGLAMAAFMLLSMTLSKRQALFMQEDSFYLFSGPFSRKQVMQYLMAQTLLQSFLLSLLSILMMTFLGGNIKLTIPFLLLSLLATMSLYMFFLILNDFIYILSITNKRYKHIAKIIMGIIIIFVLLIFILSLAQHQFDFVNGLMNFVENDLFYIVPMFGWVKLLLVSFYLEQWPQVLIALALILVSLVTLYHYFTRFKGDFYEQAMMDAIEMSDYVKQVRSGKQGATTLNAKVHEAKTTFRQGAGAIYSKNFLLMKKTRDFIRIQDIGILIFYFIISYFTKMGFGFFYYLMVLWLFQILQTSNLTLELKNYQIYLIPADPFEKLFCVLLPTLLKISILISVSVVLSGILYRMDVLVILQYLLTLLGYGLIFISGTVLSVRLLKSRSNVVAENFMRMLVILISALPSLILIVIITMVGSKMNIDILLTSSIATFITNSIVSILIIYMCKGMMNGRELNSD